MQKNGKLNAMKPPESLKTIIMNMDPYFLGPMCLTTLVLLIGYYYWKRRGISTQKGCDVSPEKSFCSLHLSDGHPKGLYCNIDTNAELKVKFNPTLNLRDQSTMQIFTRRSVKHNKYRLRGESPSTFMMREEDRMKEHGRNLGLPETLPIVPSIYLDGKKIWKREPMVREDLNESLIEERVPSFFKEDLISIMAEDQDGESDEESYVKIACIGKEAYVDESNNEEDIPLPNFSAFHEEELKSELEDHTVIRPSHSIFGVKGDLGNSIKIKEVESSIMDMQLSEGVGDSCQQGKTEKSSAGKFQERGELFRSSKVDLEKDIESMDFPSTIPNIISMGDEAINDQSDQIYYINEAECDDSSTEDQERTEERGSCQSPIATGLSNDEGVKTFDLDSSEKSINSSLDSSENTVEPDPTFASMVMSRRNARRVLVVDSLMRKRVRWIKSPPIFE